MERFTDTTRKNMCDQVTSVTNNENYFLRNSEKNIKKKKIFSLLTTKIPFLENKIKFIFLFSLSTTKILLLKSKRKYIFFSF